MDQLLLFVKGSDLRLTYLNHPHHINPVQLSLEIEEEGDTKPISYSDNEISKGFECISKKVEGNLLVVENACIGKQLSRVISLRTKPEGGFHEKSLLYWAGYSQEDNLLLY
jgi:hypothetical protein